MRIHEDPLNGADAIREEANGSMTKAARLRRAAALRHRATAASALAGKARRDAARFEGEARRYVERAAALEEDQ